MCSRLAKLNEAYVNLHRIRQSLIPKPEEIENVRMLQVTEDFIEELFREEIQKDKEEWTEKYRLQKQQREGVFLDSKLYVCLAALRLCGWYKVCFWIVNSVVCFGCSAFMWMV